MIDHLTARRTLATALDFSLAADVAATLDRHLRGCAACRSFDASLRVDAAVLRDLDFGPVPASVRAKVASAAERRGGGGMSRWFALVVVGALLLVALGFGALGAGGSATTGLGANGNPILWQTNVVDLQAADFWIEANGQQFTARVPEIAVRSDPGNATYRTLEASWREHGVEMRLNLYFGGDATNWWVSGIRVYDGKAPGDWLIWSGTWFETAIGAAWAGDLDLASAGGALHMDELVLRSMPFDGVNEPVGTAAPVLVRSNLFEQGAVLHCSGILQMSPREAEQTLLALGYKLSWRLERTTGPNTGYSEAMATAPDGVIIGEGLPGTEGELIMFVAPVGDPMAKPVPFPADCPVPDSPAPVLVPPEPSVTFAP